MAETGSASGGGLDLLEQNASSSLLQRRCVPFSSDSSGGVEARVRSTRVEDLSVSGQLFT
jgi:hypothetical protein